MGAHEQKNPKYYNEDGELRARYERTTQYPNVTKEDFDTSFMLTVGKDEIENSPPIIIDENSFSYEATGELIHLQGSEIGIPAYDVTYKTADGEEVTLKDRISLAAIGSNSDSGVLKTKFNDLATGDITNDDQLVVMQAQLENHVIAAAAFVSTLGSNPVTICPHEGSSASITVGFLTQQQAEMLTGTEQDYDGVQLSTMATFKNGTSLSNPVAYVSIWGALTRDGKDPIVNSAIPHKTTLDEISTMEAVNWIHSITEDTELTSNPDELLGYMNEHMEHYVEDEEYSKKHAKRLERTEALQPYALPAIIEGVRVFPSTIGSDPLAPFAPAIEYTQPDDENDTPAAAPATHSAPSTPSGM